MVGELLALELELELELDVVDGMVVVGAALGGV